MINKTIHLNLNNLYLLSGVSFSGKSTFTNKLIEVGIPKEAIISTDKIREQVYGTYLTHDEYGIKEHLVGWSVNSDKIFELAKNIINYRLSEDLPVFFDATNLNDLERLEIAEIAKSINKNTEVIIIDVPKEVILERSKKRKQRFSFSIVEMQFEKFQRESVLPYQIIQYNEEYDLQIEQNLIKDRNILIISDLHGEMDHFIEFINKNGWEYKNSQFIPRDGKNQKLLFLGDVIGENRKSFQLLETIINTYENGNCYFILGNHEYKLLKNREFFEKHNNVPEQSVYYIDNFFSFLSLDEKSQNKINNFLKQQKSYYQIWLDNNNNPTQNEKVAKNKFLFTHGAVESYQVFNFIKHFGIYGQESSIDLSKYDVNFKNGINDYICIKSKSFLQNKTKTDFIYSVEDLKSARNHLSILDFESLSKDLINQKSNHDIFENHTLNYSISNQQKLGIKDRIDFLEQIKTEKEHINSKEIDGIIYIQYKNLTPNVKIPNMHSNEIIGYDKTGTIRIQTISNLKDLLGIGFLQEDKFKKYNWMEYNDKTCYISKHPYLKQTIILGEKHLQSIEQETINSIKRTIINSNDNYTYLFAIKNKQIYLYNIIDNTTKQNLIEKIEEFSKIFSINYLDLQHADINKIIEIQKLNKNNYIQLDNSNSFVSILHENGYYKDLDNYLKEKFLQIQEDKPEIFSKKILGEKYYSISHLFKNIFEEYQNTKSIDETIQNIKAKNLLFLKNKNIQP